jgi:hypothetical protein
VDVVLAGRGGSLRDCRDLLLRAGFEVGAGLDTSEKCPVVLGESPALFPQALQVLEAGRHLLLADPAGLSAHQLAGLLAVRRPRQAFYIWSERRGHPAYRLISGLIRTDVAGWRPRYARHVSFEDQRSTAGGLRWLTWDSLAIVLELLDAQPEAVSASAAASAIRGSPEFLSLRLEFAGGALAFLQLGLNQTLGRRETIVVGEERTALINELERERPITLYEGRAISDRRLAPCSAPSASELARRQCVAFLQGAAGPAKAQREADLWLHVSSCWQAVETSLAEQGARVELDEPEAALRVISGRLAAGGSTTPLVRLVS